jgi:hypothetical protein
MRGRVTKEFTIYGGESKSDEVVKLLVDREFKLISIDKEYIRVLFDGDDFPVSISEQDFDNVSLRLSKENEKHLLIYNINKYYEVLRDSRL